MSGTFDKMVGKALPGTYINVESTRNDVVNSNARGTVVIPLLKSAYGPTKEFVTIYAASPDSEYSKLGASVYDDNDNMLLIREALKNAYCVKAYILGTNSKAAATVGSLTATAKYAGVGGNKFQIVIKKASDTAFDVEIYYDGSLVFKQEDVADIGSLEENDYVDFSSASAEGSAGATFTETAGTAFSGGTSAEATNTDITEFLDKLEDESFNTLCWPITGEGATTLNTALKTKIKYLRETVGKGVQAVASDFAANYEGIINVTNSVVVDEKTLTNAQATAFVAGATAGASYVTSNTYLAYEGATAIVGTRTREDAETAVKNGELIFAKNASGDIVILYDINSLVTVGSTVKKDKSYKKNRVIRVFDGIREAIDLNFPPNKFNNNEEGWLIMEGIGKALLKRFEEAGAIKNVDYDNDFKVDRSLSKDDETYFDVYIQPVDSAEKLFFTIKTA